MMNGGWQQKSDRMGWSGLCMSSRESRDVLQVLLTTTTTTTTVHHYHSLTTLLSVLVSASLQAHQPAPPRRLSDTTGGHHHLVTTVHTHNARSQSYPALRYLFTPLTTRPPCAQCFLLSPGSPLSRLPTPLVPKNGGHSPSTSKYNLRLDFLCDWRTDTPGALQSVPIH